MGSRILRQSTAKTKKKNKEVEEERKENWKWKMMMAKLAVIVRQQFLLAHSFAHSYFHIILPIARPIPIVSLSLSHCEFDDFPFYCLQFEWLMTPIYFRCVVVVHRHTAYRLGSPFVFRCQCHWKQPNPAERIPVCPTFCRFVFLLRRNHRINYAC